MQKLVRENKLNFTWRDTTKTFTLVYQYGHNVPVMKVVKQNDDVSVKKGTVPAPYTGQINVKDILHDREEIALHASNNRYILRDSHGRLIAKEDKPDDASKFVMVEIDGETSKYGNIFHLLEAKSGKYVVLSGDSDRFITRSGEG